jgi:hypothetical protein
MGDRSGLEEKQVSGLAVRMPVRNRRISTQATPQCYSRYLILEAGKNKQKATSLVGQQEGVKG